MDGYSYTGVDEHGVTQHGNVMSGTVRSFTIKCWHLGWPTLTVVNSQGVEIAGIFKREHFRNNKGWFSDVA